MFNNIEIIMDDYLVASIKEINSQNNNILNIHVAIIDSEKAIIGEVSEISNLKAKIKLLGQVIDGKLIPGIQKKPLLNAGIRPLQFEELPLILNQNMNGNMYIGTCPIYKDSKVYVSINKLLGNHFAIFGNSGSGKSCALARLIQNIFNNDKAYAYKANFLLFDVSGEYESALKDLNQINPNYNYKMLTTNSNNLDDKLSIPLWLLNSDDISLLLGVSNHSELPIIERMLKLTRIFASKNIDTDKIKNHLIAKSILSVLFNNQTAVNKKNDIFSIINTCQTNEFNMNAVVSGIGYTRKFSECFLIDKTGEFSESILITEYVSKFINTEYDNYEPTDEVEYTLDDMEKALNFTLISEGYYNNSLTYNDAVTIKVRLHSLITSNYKDIFNYKGYVSQEQYISSLIISNNKRYQVVNINLEDIDDNIGACITKIFTRIIFDFSKKIPKKGTVPFHILVDEAHRYVKNDTDKKIIGYNIFERIAKEGRKYGVILGLITQRPVELSDTVVSQISNYFIFKTNHPMDVDYIKKIVPNITSELVDKQKNMMSGTCVAFGNAFNVPLTIKLELPSPMINGENSDIVKNWGN
ncbi:MAG: ATP-binding protein [bacterium]|nr:ATP-binding protein [bacterium]